MRGVTSCIITSPPSSYDAIGNLKSKSDVGTYTYPTTGSARPHAVASIAGAVKTSSTYDANGNQLTGNGRTLTWTSFNKVKQAIKGSSTLSFSYGPNYERRIEVAPWGTVHYGGGHYEREKGRLMRLEIIQYIDIK